MSNDAEEFAWRVHSALIDWTGKVDSKASFSLTIESAVLGGIVALSGSDSPLGKLRTCSELWLYRGGILFLALGVIAAVMAVIPQIRSRRTIVDWQNNIIYFGHLRHWNPNDLAEKLLNVDPITMLARQNVAMSKIAWRKHRLLQASLALAVLGTMSACLAAV